MGKKLPIYKAQVFLKPEYTTVHGDFKNTQQRCRWVIPCPYTGIFFLQPMPTKDINAIKNE